MCQSFLFARFPAASYSCHAARGFHATGCARLPLIGETAVSPNSNLHPLCRRFIRHASQHLARNLRQHGVRKDVVDVARAAFHFGAPLGHFLDHHIVADHRDLMGFLKAALYLAQLQQNDLLQRLVAHREVGNDHHAPEKRRLEYLVQLGLQRQGQSLAVRHRLRIRRQLH